MKMWAMLILFAGMSSAAWAQDFDYRAQALKRIRATELCAIDYLGASNDVSLSLEMTIGNGSVSHAEFKFIAEECNAVMKESARRFHDNRVVRVLHASRLIGVHAPDGVHRQFVLSRSMTAYLEVEWRLPDMRRTPVGKRFQVALTGRALEIYLLQKGMGQWMKDHQGRWYMALAPQAARQLDLLAGDSRKLAVLSTTQDLTEWAQGPSMDYLQEIARIWKSKFQ